MNTTWITLNQECNLRCEWCFSSHTNFKNKNIPLEKGIELVKISKESGVKNIAFSGGEPTMYTELPDLIRYSKKLDIHTTLITNGIKLSDKDYLIKLKEAGLDFISLAIKATNEEDYYNLTKRNSFSKVLEAIKNISNNKIRLSVSFVVDSINMANVIEGIKSAKQYGAKRFFISFCYNLNIDNAKNEEYKSINNPNKVINEFIKYYDEIDKASKGNFLLSQMFPRCLWDRKFLELLIKKDQVAMKCSVLASSRLVFDADLNLIPCSVLYPYKLGKLGQDFNDSISLNKMLKNEANIVIKNKLNSVPDKICLECEYVYSCGGGCVALYSNYSLKELLGGQIIDKK